MRSRIHSIPIPADLIAQKIGEIAIKDADYYEAITRKIIDSREFLSRALQDLGWNVLPSGANFIFAGKEGLNGETVYRRLKEAGILVRYFNTKGIRDFVRITIGTHEEIKTLMESIKRLFQ